MCSSFRVCIGPWGLQLSRNTSLPFYLSQHSNMSGWIIHFVKFDELLSLLDSCWSTSKPLALPAGVYGCYSHKSFQHTSNFLEKLFRWLVPFFTQVTRSLDGPMRQLYHCSDSVTVPVLAHHYTDLVALLTSNTSGRPLSGILFIVSMI